MSMLVDSGNPEERKTLAVCITSAVPRDEIRDEPPEGDMRLFLIEKFAEVMRKTKRLFRVEVDLHEDYLFTLYTYAEPLEKKEANNPCRTETYMK